MSEFGLKGIYRDRLWDAHKRAISDSDWRPNLIVASCRVLLAAFMKSDGAPLGIQTLKIGRGDPAWDANATLPDPSITALVDQSPYTIPRAKLTLRYLDSSGQVSTTPTNRLEVIATLGQNEPPSGSDAPYPLREFGLFGQMNKGDYMIDYIRHPLIEKDQVVTLERRIQLFF